MPGYRNGTLTNSVLVSVWCLFLEASTETQPTSLDQTDSLQLRWSDSVRRKCVIADDPARCIHHHKWRRHFPLGVLARLKTQVIIEFWDTARKRGPLMIGQRNASLREGKLSASTSRRGSQNVSYNGVRLRARLNPVEQDLRLHSQTLQFLARLASMYMFPREAELEAIGLRFSRSFVGSSILSQ
jgi:hypothetical protein